MSSTSLIPVLNITNWLLMTFTVCFWTTKKLSLDVFKELGKVTATRNEERGTGTGKMKQTMYVKKMYVKKNTRERKGKI